MARTRFPALPRTALSRGPAGSIPELAARLLEEYVGKIRFAVETLAPDDLWWRPAPGCNGVGNLLLHLAGNLSLWIGSGLGGEPYERDRAAEFAAREGADAATLLDRLDEVVARATAIVRRLDQNDLRRQITVQGYRTAGLDALIHAVEHMSYHTGQILMIAKARLPPGRELELYPQHRGE